MKVVSLFSGAGGLDLEEYKNSIFGGESGTTYVFGTDGVNITYYFGPDAIANRGANFGKVNFGKASEFVYYIDSVDSFHWSISSGTGIGNVNTYHAKFYLDEEGVACFYLENAPSRIYRAVQ